MFSTMKVVCVVALLVGTVVADVGVGCDTISYYYLELGCTPIRPAGNATGCPKAFNCSDNMYPDTTKCYYRGVSYESGELIPQADILNPCSRSCVCQVSESGARFECAQVDCVEEFSSEKRECVPTFESLNECCTTGTVCGKDAIAALATCDFEGLSYKAGQTFESSNRHKTCLCTNKWDGNVDNPANCRDVNCGVELHYQTKIRQKCAPVFYEDVRGGGCPISYQCPNESIKVTRLNKPVEVTEKCIFGNDTLSVGDEVTVMEKCVTCSCRVPPNVVCVRTLSCDN